MSEALKTRAGAFFRMLQDEITSSLENIDGAERFREDSWERPGGGGGRSRIMTEGSVFEKAGVNFSAVYGESPKMLQRTDEASTFYATGISLVLHPRSPMIPTIHANFRYFEQSTGEAWFGGGIDLTPYYLNESDVRNFHATIRTTCDRHDNEYYPRFKKWCDEYFFLKHRGETRGVGGIFFDHLTGDAAKVGQIFLFVQDIGRTFIPSYAPIVLSHKNESYTEDQRQWQLLRHGRYVEFNLVYDKGTLFGLQTNGRTESILMSLPTLARWEYDMQPAAGSPEDKLLQVLKQPCEWA